MLTRASLADGTEGWTGWDERGSTLEMEKRERSQTKNYHKRIDSKGL
jgi:hypothetical protein